MLYPQNNTAIYTRSVSGLSTLVGVYKGSLKEVNCIRYIDKQSVYFSHSLLGSITGIIHFN